MFRGTGFRGLDFGTRFDLGLVDYGTRFGAWGLGGCLILALGSALLAGVTQVVTDQHFMSFQLAKACHSNTS